MEASQSERLVASATKLGKPGLEESGTWLVPLIKSISDWFTNGCWLGSSRYQTQKMIAPTIPIKP